MQNQWDNFFRDNGRFYILPHPELARFINILKANNKISVLDLGCGSGRHLVELAAHNLEVTGIDYSPAAAQTAEEWLHAKNLNGKVYVGNFFDELQNFGSNSFDALVAIDSLQYVANIHDFEKVISEIAKVLKPAGHALFVIPSKRTLILQPNVPQVFLEETDIRLIVDKFFETLETYQDQNNSLVILATNQKS